jgi:hypothetical protein
MMVSDMDSPYWRFNPDKVTISPLKITSYGMTFRMMVTITEPDSGFEVRMVSLQPGQNVVTDDVVRESGQMIFSMFEQRLPAGERPDLPWCEGLARRVLELFHEGDGNDLVAKHRRVIRTEEVRILLHSALDEAVDLGMDEADICAMVRKSIVRSVLSS